MSKGRAHLKAVTSTVTEIPYQAASIDIWDKKYRLKTKNGEVIDHTVDDTYKRIAHALAEVEETAEKREEWYEKFLWALRHGAIPAGRITSNAGAWAYKPATSTINCTVSGTIEDSMDDILQKVHEAGLTLKAGCVAPNTTVVTEHGTVSAERAVRECHGQILCFDRDSGRFEMRPILRHLTTCVPRQENIELVSNGVRLKTSIKHPVLVYRDDRLVYVRADEVSESDALVHHAFPWQADGEHVLEAWFTGLRFGLAIKTRAKRDSRVLEMSCDSHGQGVAAASLVAAMLVDEMADSLSVPDWIATQPECYFLRFLAGFISGGSCVDTDGGGGVTIATTNVAFAREMRAMLGLFGVRAGLSVRDGGEAIFKISDSAFLAKVAEYMVEPEAKDYFLEHASQAGQYDHYVVPHALREALAAELPALGHGERQTLGFYHGYHTRRVVSRVWLDRWEVRFPHLKAAIAFARTLRPLEAVRRELDLGETFYDFTVERHNNYLAGEGGLMVIHNCGIGYDFSTLRPRGAFVAGAGAYTSGPLSFMDIYDKMCFTVSSAGGRRGAQMATFDVGHPDVADFVRAKRESGRLRQFNLSLLVTREFMEAVKADAEWRLAFPVCHKEVELDRIDLDDPRQVVWRDWPTDGQGRYIRNEEGLYACKVYRTLKARNLWNLIMSSTYDYAEPGFILIDQYNEMNNNWFCENIRATNPCVTADTWVQTAAGPRQVADLIGAPFLARVDGVDHATGPEGFFRTATKPVMRLVTAEGYSLRLTADHRVRRVTHFSRWTSDSEWCAAGDLKAGDRVLLNDHRAAVAWAGAYGHGEGYLMGLLLGDGTLAADGEAVLCAWRPAAAANGEAAGFGVDGRMAAALGAAEALPRHADFRGWMEVAGRGEFRLSTAALDRIAADLGLTAGGKRITPAMEKGSSDFYRGLLRGLFDSDGSVQGSQAWGVSVRLAQSDLELLRAAQRMLLRLGIASRIHRDRRVADSARHELVIAGENLIVFRDLIGFADTEKGARLDHLLATYGHRLSRERFVARVEAVVADGTEEVYDVQVPGINTFDANGLHAHNCGEQGLPAYGACLLGSINLTKYVVDPFTERARFDWESFRRAVAIFTRMLDNVVEINGLPLAQQRAEIMSKRRHGMGYLGLGSTLTMLRMRYGEADSAEFTEQVTRELAIEGWRTGLALAREKGPAPLMEQEFEVTPAMLCRRPEMRRDGYQVGDKVKGKVLHARYSRYMQRVAEVEPHLVQELAEVGCRFTHHSSIAPTGTISLSLANNASNGIEPSFAHHYARNVIREGRKTKEKVDVYSFELLAYRELINPLAMPFSDKPEEQLPDYFVAADNVTPRQHVDIQAAAQKWIDSSISKTANVPTDYPYEEFKDIYLYAYEKDLKGCTTFRFNPEAFQGVLVKEKDLASTTYRFELEGGQVVELKGNEEIEYDGEVHTAANLFDALKEGYYGKF